MGDGLFGDVDLSQLAGSEGAIVKSEEVVGTPTPPVEEKKEEKTGEKEQPKAEPANEDGIDISFLENSETAIVTETDDKLESKIEEEPGNKDTKTSQTPATGTEDSPSSITNTLTSFKHALKEAGVFSLPDEELEEVKDAESLVKALEKQIKEREFEDLNEDQKKYLEAVRSGVPHHEYSEHNSNADQYKQLADSDIKEKQNLQHELVRRKFLVKGESEENALRYANMAIESGKGEFEAFAAQKELISYEEGLIQKKIDDAKALQEKTEKDAIEKLNKMKSELKEKSEIISGIKINSQTKDKVYDSLVNITEVGDNKTPMNDVMKSYSEDEEYKIRLHTLHVITKGFTDFSKFEKTSKSNAIKELDNKLSQKSTEIKGGSGATGGNTGSTTLSIREALQNLKLK